MFCSKNYANRCKLHINIEDIIKIIFDIAVVLRRAYYYAIIPYNVYNRIGVFMDFVWAAKGREQKNHTLAFCLNEKFVDGDALSLCAADVYRVICDGVLVSYGPSRTAAGFCRVRNIELKKCNNVIIEVAGYNTACYCNDLTLPYFGAEVSRKGKVIYNTNDWQCVRIDDRVTKVIRYSYQRNYTEIYKQSFDKSVFYAGKFGCYPHVEKMRVQAPVILDDGEDNASYESIDFFATQGEYTLNEEPHWWLNDLENGIADGYQSADWEVDLYGQVKQLVSSGKGQYYALPYACTGFLKLNIEVKTPAKVRILFDEYNFSGDDRHLSLKWGRSTCCDVVGWDLAPGKYSLTTFEPYELKYAAVFVEGQATDAEISLIKLHNKDCDALTLKCSDSEIESIFNAGRNTFAQNALDIFMDCPGRERAGWLCDSYFAGRAESVLCGNNRIEKRMMQNFLHGNWEEIDKRMLPMCFPAQHRDRNYIPNWAMWFVAELGEYYKATGDNELISLAKDKVNRLLEFFDQYVNSDGLLENLEGWVFVDWTIANSAEYVGGVSYPSNMMFYLMLETAAKLYNDEGLSARAGNIKSKILEQSFDGKFFADNAVRNEHGILYRQPHITESCQYYALFCGITSKESFVDQMLTEFGPSRKSDCYPEIAASNAFIGNFLRLMWLSRIGEYRQLIKEIKEYFYPMALRTGTLWEKMAPEASCNHGFASVVCYLLINALSGFEGADPMSGELKWRTENCGYYDSVISMPQYKVRVNTHSNGKRVIEST